MALIVIFFFLALMLQAAAALLAVCTRLTLKRLLRFWSRGQMPLHWRCFSEEIMGRAAIALSLAGLYLPAIALFTIFFS